MPKPKQDDVEDRLARIESALIRAGILQEPEREPEPEDEGA